jgi:AcrR family transcriptional regulator
MAAGPMGDAERAEPECADAAFPPHGAPGTPRAPGRPRSSIADAAIIAAAVDSLEADGFDGLTVDGVAARAGVSKATIYRRYPSKIDLVLAAAQQCIGDIPIPLDTGSLRGDLEATAQKLVALVATTPAGRIMPMLVAEISRNPELGDAFRDYIGCRRRISMEMAQRAIARGELQADTDVEVMVDVLAGPIFYRSLVSGGPLDEHFVRHLVDAVTRAYAA